MKKYARIFAVIFVLSVLMLSVVACSHDCKGMHTWDEGTVTVAPTCKEEGVTVYTCTVCGAKRTVPVEKLQHTWDSGVVTKPATCTENGVTTFTCSVCNETKTEVLAMCAHTLGNWIGDVAASCKDTGTKGHYECSACNGLFDADKNPVTAESLVLPTVDHTFENWTVVDAATCIAEGLESSACSVCGTTTTRPIAKVDHTVVVDAAVAATCTEAGKTEGSHCSACGEVLVAQQVVAATGHVHSSWEVVEAATCTSEGLEKSICSVCNTEETRTIAKLAHTVVVDAAVAATCTTSGLTQGSHCSVCNTVIVAQAVIAATGHTAEDWIVTKSATCEETGSRHKECSVCGTTFNEEIIPRLDHTLVVDEAVAPTCTESGKTQGSHCSVCGKVYVAQSVIPATGHSADAWVVDSEATCTEDGLRHKECSVCGESFAQETIAKLNHIIVVDNAVAATCTEAGLTQGTHCSRCGEVITAQQEIPAKGHKIFVDYAVAATCTEDGLTQGSHCAVCDEVLVAQQVIPALGHTMVEDAAVAATCTTDGKTAGSHCATCGLVEVAQTVVPATGHSFGEEITVLSTCTTHGYIYKKCANCYEVEIVAVLEATGHVPTTDEAVAPTCTTDGLKSGSHCSACGAILEAQEVDPATGHAFGLDVFTCPATCTEQGYTYHKCTYCDEIDVISTIPATGHTEVTDAAVAPTCTATGLTEGSHCSVCDAIIVAQQVVAATGHTTEEISAVAPTCTTAGLTAGSRCSVCGEIIVAQQEVAALGHTAVVDAAVPATCTATGLSEGSHCSVCGETIVAQEVVAALGHTAGEWASDSEGHWHICSVCGLPADEAVAHTEVADAAVAPTCTEAGLIAGSHCSACGEILVAQQEVAALGHTAEEIPAVAATCTATGLTAGSRCSVCGEILVAQQEVAALGHTVEEIPAVAATCTEAGLAAGSKCSVCGEILVAQQEVAALGHTAGEWIVDVAPTCTTAGSKHTECTVCGATVETAEVAALGHTAEEIPAVAATCTEAGLTAGSKCSVCGEILVAQQEVAALGHTLSAEWASDGEGHWHVCSVCGLPADEAIAHTVVHDAANIPHDCVTAGVTSGSHCSVCGYVIVAQQVIDPLGHTYAIDVAVAPTCTETGLTQGAHCSACGEILIAQQVVPANGHTVAENYTYNNDSHWKVCAVCGVTVVDAEAHNLDLNCTICGWVSEEAAASVVINGNKVCYETLTQAVAAVPADGVQAQITLLHDVTEPGITVSAGQNIVFDLNNHTYTVCEAPVSMLARRVISPDKHGIILEADSTIEICNGVIALAEDAGISVLVSHSNSLVLNNVTIDASLGAGIKNYALSNLAGDVVIVNTLTLISREGDGVAMDLVYTGSEGTKVIVNSGNTLETVGKIEYGCDAADVVPGWYEQVVIIIDGNVCGVTTAGDIAEGGTLVFDNYESFFEKLDVSEIHVHVYGPWEVVVPATCLEEGLEQRVCLDDICAHHSETRPLAALGHNYQAVVTAPTCTTEGYTTHTCSNCGDTFVDSTVAAFGHAYGTAIWTWTDFTATAKVVCAHDETHVLEATAAVVNAITTEPTCTTVGTRTYTATVTLNGIIYTSQKAEELPALGHTAVVDEAVAPTCTTTGLTEGSHCSVCGEILVAQQEVAALGHTAGEWIVDVEPTCTTAGSKHKECTVCGATVETAEIAALGHDYEAVVTAPTCTAEGYTTHTCTRCGDTYTDNVVAALGHSVVTDAAVAATCTTSGLTEGSHCSVCGEVLVAQTVVPAKRHAEEEIPAVAPTCTETGLTAGTKCSVCGTVLVAQEVVAATGHTAVADAAVAATCTETGLTEGSHCSVCNEVLVAQTVVPATGHTETTIPAVAATCTTAGLTAGTKCSVCGEILVAQQEIAALDHKVVTDAAVAATCTKDGLTEGSHCSVCNEVLVAQTVVSALGHDYEAVVTAPTCTTAGYTTHTCTRCNDTYTDNEVAALDHKVVTDAAVAATCTKDGLTEGSHCSVCDEVLVAQEVVAALGHDYETVVTAPTCTTAGYTTHTCTRCNDTYTDNEVAALDHTVVVDAAVAATCTETGLTEGSHCSVCGTILVAQEVVAALGHDYEAVVTAPTCTAEGYTTHTCTRCGDTYTDNVVAALGHTVVVDAAVPATCTATGLTEGSHCSVCGEVLVAQEVVPATGHTPSDWIIDTEATCTDEGIKYKKCTVCDAELEDEIIPALGHNIVENVCTNDGCTYEMTPAEIVTAAFALGNKEYLTGTYKLTGVITKVINAYDEDKGITLYFTVEGNSLEAYRMKGTGADEITVGDEITVVGSIMRYSDVIVEFAQGCTLASFTHTAYNINVTANNSTVTLADGTAIPATAANGSTIEFKVTAESGYKVDSVKVNGKVVTATGEIYTATVVGEAITIVVETSEELTCVVEKTCDIDMSFNAIGSVGWLNSYGNHSVDYSSDDFNGTIVINASKQTGTITTYPVTKNKVITMELDPSIEYTSITFQFVQWTTKPLGDITVYVVHSDDSEEEVYISVDNGFTLTYNLTGIQDIKSLKTSGNNDNQAGVAKISITYLLSLHEWEKTAENPATCTEDGSRTYTCKACGDTKTEIIPATGHAIVHHNAQAATCTEAGWEAYDTCENCDYTTKVTIPALGHDYEAVVTAPTCTAQGYTTHTCTRCGDSYTDNEVAALAHTPAGEYYSDALDHWQLCSVCHQIAGKAAHTAGTEWVSDENNHWHVCTACATVMDKSAHTYTDGKCVCGADEPTTPFEPVVITEGVTLAEIYGAAPSGEYFALNIAVTDSNRDTLAAIKVRFKYLLVDGEFKIGTVPGEFLDQVSQYRINIPTGEVVVDHEYTVTLHGENDALLATIKFTPKHSTGGGELTPFEPVVITENVELAQTYGAAPYGEYFALKLNITDDNKDTLAEIKARFSYLKADDGKVGIEGAKGEFLNCGTFWRVNVPVGDVLVGHEYKVELFDSSDNLLATINFTPKPGTPAQAVSSFVLPADVEYVKGDEANGPNDKLIYWHVLEASWGCGSVVTMHATTYENGVVTLNYVGGDVLYSVQLFYKSGSLTKNTAYKLTFVVEASKAGTIQVNGTTINVAQGENLVSVDYTPTTDIATILSVQFWGSDEDVTYTVYNISWNVPNSEHDHLYTHGTVTTAATCTEAGVKTFTCSVCGETKTEDIAAAGHAAVVDAAVPATCTATGLTEGSHCSVCGKILVAQQVVAATGHNIVENVCTNDGCSYEMTPAEIVTAAFALGNKESLAGTYKLTGIVTKVVYNYTESNGITLYFTVEEKSLEAYKLKGTGADEIIVGDEITVVGSIMRYSDVIVEFAQGCTLTSFTHTAYNINVTANNSTVTLADGTAIPATAANGSTIEFKVTAADDYKVDGVTVNGEELTANSDGVYAFVISQNTAIEVATSDKYAQVFENALVAALTFPDDNKGSNNAGGYKDTPWIARKGDLTWSITYFNNNNWNSSWTYIKAGSNKTASTATIDTQFTVKLSSVEFVIDTLKSGINSIKLVIATDADFSDIVETIESDNLIAGTMLFTIPTKYQTTAYYYRIAVDCEQVSSNGPIQVSAVRYYQKACAHAFTEAIGDAVAATCSTDGKTAGLKCKHCGEIIEAQAIIPATGLHNFVDGVCSVCDALEDAVQKFDIIVHYTVDGVAVANKPEDVNIVWNPETLTEIFSGVSYSMTITTDKYYFTVSASYEASDIMDNTYSYIITADLTVTIALKTKPTSVEKESKSFAATSGTISDSIVSYKAFKGGADTAPGVYGNEIRLYQVSGKKSYGGYVTISVPEGYKIQSVTIGSSKSTTINYILGAETKGDGSNSPAFEASNISLTAGSTYTVNNISTNAITFYCLGSGSSARLYLNYLSVTYAQEG